MLETYAVGVKLEMTSNVAGVLDKLMRDVERFNTLVKESSGLLDRLGKDIRELRTAGSSVNSLVKAMEKLNTATKGGTGAGQFDKMASAIRAAETAADGMTGILRENARLAADMAKSMNAAARVTSGSSGSRTSGHGSSRFSEHNVMMAGMGAGIVGGALIGGVRYTMTPAIDIARTRDVLAADTRLSPDQVDAALARARETTKLAPGTTTGENLASILDLKNIFGDLSEAQTMVPKFAQMTSLFQALDRKGGGSGEQAYAAGKALEVMAGMVDEHVDAQGHTVRTISPELGMHRLDLMTRTAVATNMRVMPTDYLGFAKQARVAGMTLSDEFIYEKLPAMMQVLGGPRVGTALMSMAQVFKGDKLTNKSMDALMEIGLAGPGGITYGKPGKRGGKGKATVHPDAIYDLPLMMHDTQLYLEQAQKRMEGKGIHGTEAQVTALMRASQRSTIAGIFADILKDMPAILKEQQNTKATRMDMAQHMADVDPAAKVQQFEAALTNLATELGSAGMKDAMTVLDAATAGLNKLGEWAHNNPNLARIAFDTGAGLGAVATGLGALSTAILVFGPALKLLGIAGGGGSTGRAVAGITAKVAGVALDAPLAAVGAGIGMAISSGLDPDYAANEKARQLASGRASAAASQSSPQSSGFVPADGYGVDGRPIQMQGTLNIDGNKLGLFMAKGITGAAGMTGHDPRMTQTPTGATGAN